MTTTQGILWGSMGPDSHRIDTALEKAVGKRQSLPHLALAWAYGRNPDGSINYAPFPTVGGQANPYSFLTPNEYPTDLPVYMDWVSWDLNNQADPAFDLETITAGKHDAFLHQWAKSAAAFGRPVLLRFDSEFNGNWWRWGAKPTQFVAAWKYLHDLFLADGATNIAWHWCPNVLAPAGTQYPTATDKLSPYYPGDAYVDWTGFDSYNWFTGKNSPWMTFAQTTNGYPSWYGPTYDTITKLAPNKPMLIGEFNCWDDARKPAWLFDALTLLPLKFPKIRGISLFNWAQGEKWPLTGASLAAFGQGIANPVYLAGGDWTPPMGQPLVAPQLSVGLIAPVPDQYRQYGTTWDAVAAGLEGLIASYREQHLEDAATIAEVGRQLVTAKQDASASQRDASDARAALAQVQGHLQALVQLGGAPTA